MIRAASNAGLPGAINLIHEPEAAAILCFAEDHASSLRAFDYQNSQAMMAKTVGVSLAGRLLRRGVLRIPQSLNSILVLDAGAGTVDLVTYKVETKGPDLVVKEGIRGTGMLSYEHSMLIVKLTGMQLDFTVRVY